MNKVLKRVITACLTLALFVTVLSPVVAEAATKTRSLTLYKGEAIYVTDYNKVKSVSSSKKSVVSVAKDKKNNKNANITAKKTGKATVTVKTAAGTYKYNITVKKLDVSVTMTDMGAGYILLTVKNNTKQTFTGVAVEYSLKDESGSEVAHDVEKLYDVVAGKTAYKTLYYSSYSYTPDLTQCSAKAVAAERNPSYSYKNQTSNFSVKYELNDGKIVFTLSNKSKTTAINGKVYALCYDANDNVIGLVSTSAYLKGGAKDTTSRLVSTGTDHVKIVSSAYSYHYNN